MTGCDVDPISELRRVPEFVEFAQRKMSSDPDRWRNEARSGAGFTRKLAIAVVEIAGGGLHDP